MRHTTGKQLGARFPDELVSSSLFLLKRLGMAAKEGSLAGYEELGLHPYHHAILAVLDEGSRETQGAIADALGYDKGQLVGLLDELEAAGLVERRRDPNDRRRHVVQMTPEGRKTLRRLRTLSLRLENEFLASLDATDRERFHTLLVRLAEQHLPRCQLTPPATVERS
ncbi:MAG TPA: MarR family winged helix-turn-helix transcriptional regulator [Gaiellaceae bacterium]|nr:MarR family winged helix-turn-helix transcriptional regulator [Gaiellaceae bacterium]